MEEHLKNIDEIALNFMNYYALRIDGQLAMIAETEIYYDSPEHPDLFCHKHEKQQELESGYFHYSGYDVTFSQDGAYVGALVRGIQWAEGDNAGKYLFGPGRVGYNWKPKKTRRNIELVKNCSFAFHLHTVGEPYVFDKKILKLPRVNLSKERMLNAVASGEAEKIARMKEVLNRKARYLRVPDRFWETGLKHKPDDLKSVVSCIF